MDSNIPLPLFNTDYQCFFDNIVFAPFIFIEDPNDIDSSSGLTDLMGSVSASTSVPSAGLTTPFRTTNKVDPYFLIMNVGGKSSYRIPLILSLLGPARSTQG